MLMMLTLKIMSVYDWLYLRKAKFMFKVYNNLTQQYISDHSNLRNNLLDTNVSTIFSHL